MSRKHFTALAKMVRSEVKDGSGSIGYEKLAYLLANFCAEQNPNFDRSRFMQACGVDN